MKALVEKDKLMKKQEKEMRKAPHFFMYIYQGNSREHKGTHLNSFEPIELKGTHLNLVEPIQLQGTQGNTSELI